MKSRFGAFLVGLLLLFMVFALVYIRDTWKFNHSLNSSVDTLSEDQSALVEFVKQNPDLADELNDLTKLVGSVRRNYVKDEPSDELLKLAMKGIPEALDPNNFLYIGQEVEELKKTFGEENYFGIGLVIQSISKYIFIVRVLPDSPSEKADLRPGDIILKVNGQSVWGLSPIEVSNMVKGKEGTPVSLEIQRATSQQPFEVVLSRKRIVVVSVEYSVVDRNIGYIKVNSCEEETVNRFFDAVGRLKNAKGLIIDLRNNPGGLVNCAQALVGYFVGIGQPVIVEKDRNSQYSIITNITRGLYPKKIVVLVNNSSASASEIIAGNLRHYKVATLVGVRTYGKQTVQQFFDVNTGYPIPDIMDYGGKLALRLTIAHYFLPDGTNVSENGVTPDIEVEQPSDFKLFEYKTVRDLQFRKAIEILNTK